MTLISDIQAGIAALQPHHFDITERLADGGFAVILIPFPKAPVKLPNDELSIQIRLAAGGRFFTMFTALALVDGPIEASVYQHLLRRNYFADQVGAASYALMSMDEEDGLVAAIHWPFNHIEPAPFTGLFQNLIEAKFMMLKELLGMSAPGLHVMGQ